MKTSTAKHPENIAEKVGNSIAGSKVLLINMPIREHVLPNNPPLGPLQIAAVLKGFDVDVEVLDLNAYRKNGAYLGLLDVKNLIREKLHGNDFDLMAMSGLITTLAWQSKIAKIIRKYAPLALLCTGGGLATEFKTTLFEWIPELNYVVSGEGDDIVLQLLYDAIYRDHSTTENVQCFYHGDRPDFFTLPSPCFGALHSNILEGYIQNPVWGGSAKNSSAAPFFSDRSLSMVSSRGCPHACKFCYRGQQGGNKYGMKSADMVVKEMLEIWEKYDLDFIGIIDDNFMVNAGRIRDIALKLRGKDIRWGTHGRLDDAARGNNVELMADAGCVYIGFGAESASPKIIKAMGKGGHILKNGTVEIDGYHFPKTMVDGIIKTHQAGIHANCTWIMGYPGETLQDLKTSVAFMKWQESIWFGSVVANKEMFVATAYPGTELFKTPIVREKLGKVFGIEYDNEGEPINNEAMRQYVKKLSDASLLLLNDDGEPLNFSDMPDEVFLQAKSYIETGQTYKILEM